MLGRLHDLIEITATRWFRVAGGAACPDERPAGFLEIFRNKSPPFRAIDAFDYSKGELRAPLFGLCQSEADLYQNKTARVKRISAPARP